ncbi:hypothetical protein J4G33_06000 [Actinotalea sp. BY-33]|uniref:Uncharacterized protein n=2 Tax=Actinotalea soli TaxID=2819234 RepID=A0A939LNT8_9CELL|nr:hypothetical protein [Actinotalea soli]
MSAGDISLVAGTAGAEVVAVAYRSTTHGEVHATVNGGHFALWFPGDELRDGATEGVQLEATFRDGSTATAVLTLT